MDHFLDIVIVGEFSYQPQQEFKALNINVHNYIDLRLQIVAVVGKKIPSTLVWKPIDTIIANYGQNETSKLYKCKGQ